MTITSHRSIPNETRLRVNIHCECGYLANGHEDLTDHYREIFTPGDDKGIDGLVHAEAARDFPGNDGVLACLCGYTGAIDALDEHFLGVFAPADRTGRDGRKHGTGQAAAAHTLEAAANNRPAAARVGRLARQPTRSRHGA
jgi:hypothetical protein